MVCVVDGHLTVVRKQQKAIGEVSYGAEASIVRMVFFSVYASSFGTALSSFVAITAQCPLNVAAGWRRVLGNMARAHPLRLRVVENNCVKFISGILDYVS